MKIIVADLNQAEIIYVCVNAQVKDALGAEVLTGSAEEIDAAFEVARSLFGHDNVDAGCEE